MPYNHQADVDARRAEKYADGFRAIILPKLADEDDLKAYEIILFARETGLTAAMERPKILIFRNKERKEVAAMICNPACAARLEAFLVQR